MKKQIGMFSVVITVVGLVAALVILIMAQKAIAGQTETASYRHAQVDQSGGGTDSNPIGTPEIVIPEQYRPAGNSAASAAATAGSVSTVYFTPQDENTSTTVLFLYNTNPTTATVGLQTFFINGSLTISTSVAVPPLGLTRICADSVNTVSASWQNTVLVNFTTFSTYAKMTLPAGVKADGYVAWDLTGVYDPLSNTVTLPLRFSADPATVFLPTTQQ